MDQNSRVTGAQSVAELIKTALASGLSALDEFQSKALFRAYGIPVPEGEMVKTDSRPRLPRNV